MRYAVLLVFLGGCSSIFGDCEEKVQNVDVVFGSTYDVALSIVDAFKRQGYDCTPTPIRNAAGTRIGDQYTCKKCD